MNGENVSFDKEQKNFANLKQIISEQTIPTVIWVGSGLSVDAGVPTWAGLRRVLEKALEDKAQSLDKEDGATLLKKGAAIKQDDNLWVAFERYRQVLGATTYKTRIKEAFNPALKADIPDPYKLLWKLPVKGILTLNIDHLLTRAFTEVHPGKRPSTLIGMDIARLQSSIFEQSFIGNLHGSLDDYESWIFTKSDLRGLTNDESFMTVIRGLLSSFVNVFVGISPDDEAIGGHLDALADQGVQGQRRFWITHRSDATTDNWAEQAGISRIVYTLEGQGHASLCDALTELANAIPMEVEIKRPVISRGRQSMEVEDVDLDQVDTETLRRSLNAEAKAILSANNHEAIENYNDFSVKYDEYIYRAWYASTQPGKNMLLGNTLEQEVAEGAFGRVFRAIDEQGNPVAIKLLRDSVRRDPDMLQTFRRGVRSMRILSGHQTVGSVGFIDASEIPAFISMEWIEGPTLKEAKESGAFVNWTEILSLAVEISRIVHASHLLPERILHRDLRPNNIMLRNYWIDPEEVDVVVLDYDLSWHKGSYEQSIVFSSATGYMAPEQIVNRPKESTRHSAVDSFGLGMTLYYLAGGKDPSPGAQLSPNWLQEIRNSTSQLGPTDWACTANRFQRLIEYSTLDAQSLRWDMSQMVVELERLNAAHLGVSIHTPAMLAEEVMCRSRRLKDYSFDPDGVSFEKSTPTGLKVVAYGDEQTQQVLVLLEWSSTGVEQWKNLGKYMKAKSEKAKAILVRDRWVIEDFRSDLTYVMMKISCSVDDFSGSVGPVCSAFDGAVQTLVFE